MPYTFAPSSPMSVPSASRASCMDVKSSKPPLMPSCTWSARDPSPNSRLMPLVSEPLVTAKVGSSSRSSSGNSGTSAAISPARMSSVIPTEIISCANSACPRMRLSTAQMFSGSSPVDEVPMSMMSPLSAAVTASDPAASVANRLPRLMRFSILMPCAKKSPMGSFSSSGYGASPVTSPRSGAVR